MAHADIHADTHVFGSTRGYGTVASSSGVRADETRELEQFQFGEAATADRIARLESHAVMTGRPLRSGRIAISRMMPAGNDDAGRPTIEVVTLLLEARDYEACAGALPMLAEDAGFWRSARASAAAGGRVPAIAPVADANDPRVFRLFDLWRAAVRAGAVGVVAENESESVLRLVASLDPADRARCRWGIGLLSISAPADLCSIASGTSTHGARDVLRPAQSGAWHCGSESEYAAFRVTSGLARFPSAADIEVNGRELVVQDWATGAAAAAQPKRTEKRPKPLLPLAIGSAVMSTAVLAVALVMWDRRGGGEVVVAPAPSKSATVQDASKRHGTLLFDPIDPTPESSSAIGPEQSPAPPSPPAQPPAPSSQGAATADQRPAPTAQPPAPPAQPSGSATQTTDPPAPKDSQVEQVSASPPQSADKLSDAIEKLRLTPEVRWFSQREIQAPPFDGRTADAHEAALRNARSTGHAVAQQLIALVAFDQSLKQVAHVHWSNGAAETMAWSLITLDNGFICEFPPNGPGSDAQEDRVLNQDRLGRWQAVLEEFNRIRPDSKAQELAKKWDEGVRGAFDQIAKDDPYKDAKVSADRLLLSEREGDFTREANRVKAILEIGEPEDQKPLSSERRRK